jgi:hypothetical protein
MHSRLIPIAVLAFASGPVAAQVVAPPTAVALSGTSAPGGGNYLQFLTYGLNGTGQVAFIGDVTGSPSRRGIFSGAPGALQPVALTGTAAPAGGNYSNFDSLRLNGVGQVEFHAELTGAGEGIFAGVPGSLQSVAIKGQPAPAGGNYFGLYGPVLNEAGKVAFLASLNASSGLFAGAPSSLQTVALTGTAAPAGGNYLGFNTPTLSGAGQVAFLANLTGGTSPGGVFVGTTGSLHAVYLTGTAAPAGGMYNGGTTFPALNDAGKVAFLANLTGGTSSQGIFAGVPGSVQAVALQGNTAPAGGTYARFTNPLLNAAGQVAFFATLVGGTSPQGIFAGAPGSLQPVALQGAPAPRGGTYSFSTAGNFNNSSLFQFNGAGQVAFIADLVGGSSSSGVFAGSPGNVLAIVVVGDVIDVDPGPGVDNRTAFRINFPTGSGGPYNGGTLFNDTGLLIYGLEFTDGTSGIFTSRISAVPEPSSALLVICAVGLLAIRGRRALQRPAPTTVQ